MAQRSARSACLCCPTCQATRPLVPAPPPPHPTWTRCPPCCPSPAKQVIGAAQKDLMDEERRNKLAFLLNHAKGGWVGWVG